MSMASSSRDVLRPNHAPGYKDGGKRLTAFVRASHVSSMPEMTMLAEHEEPDGEAEEGPDQEDALPRPRRWRRGSLKKRPLRSPPFAPRLRVRTKTRTSTLAREPKAEPIDAGPTPTEEHADEPMED